MSDWANYGAGGQASKKVCIRKTLVICYNSNCVKVRGFVAIFELCPSIVRRIMTVVWFNLY